MKNAVVTDDLLTISAHFGGAPYYEVFSIEDGRTMKKESILKPSHEQFANEPHDEAGYAHREGPLARGHHARMLAAICDCHVFFSARHGTGRP